MATRHYKVRIESTTDDPRPLQDAQMLLLRAGLSERTKKVQEDSDPDATREKKTEIAAGA